MGTFQLFSDLLTISFSATLKTWSAQLLTISFSATLKTWSAQVFRSPEKELRTGEVLLSYQLFSSLNTPDKALVTSSQVILSSFSGPLKT
jgi:hypothetical protein